MDGQKNEEQNQEPFDRDALILSHIKWAETLAAKYAKRYQRIDLLEDLKQAAISGLIESIATYQPSKGKLITHATFWIIRNLNDLIGVSLHQIIIPRNERPLVNKLRKQLTNPEEPTEQLKPEEKLENVDLHLKHAAHITSVSTTSLEAPTRATDGEGKFADRLGKVDRSFEQLVAENLQQKVIQYLSKRLKPHNLEAMILYLFGDQQLSIKKIGKMLKPKYKKLKHKNLVRFFHRITHDQHFNKFLVRMLGEQANQMLDRRSGATKTSPGTTADPGVEAKSREQLTQLAKNLRRLRQRTGIPVKMLATPKAYGYSISFIMQMEQGEKFPALDKLKKIAKTLGVKVSDLFAAENEFLKLLETSDLLSYEITSEVAADLPKLNEMQRAEILAYLEKLSAEGVEFAKLPNNNDEVELFFQNLKKLQEKLKLSDTKLAKAMGVSKTALKYWRTGKMSPMTDRLLNFPAIFGIAVHNFFLPGFDDLIEDALSTAMLPYVRTLSVEQKSELLEFISTFKAFNNKG